MVTARRYPIGAELMRGAEAHFRVWAPRSKDVKVEIVSDGGALIRTHALTPEKDGYFSGALANSHAGQLYRFRLDGGSYPDPASRFQPAGPHGASQLIDPVFVWTDSGWRGRAPHELIIYELHVGTFTTEGTWRAASEKLPLLAATGITMIEIMPVAEFPGSFGWGYDGVDLFAPTRLYGSPDDFRRFVDRAHALGLAVILDVVYNHFGPDGNYLREFSADYFSARYANEWGDPINFDGPNNGPVREMIITNARYWIEEFHLDGLRLDATQQIFDASQTHILAELMSAARLAAGDRQVFIVAENEAQHARLVRPAARGGYGITALWNDDFHHTARVAATGRAEAYYSPYRGTAQEFVSAAKFGFLYQGQWYGWQQQRRGRPALDLQRDQLVHFLQNHDQIANSLRGLRLHQSTSPGRLRALTALLLLSPQIPMLFQGQEFAASAPFLYFADHHPELAEKVANGRRAFLSQFSTVATPESQRVLSDPRARATFERCKLDWTESDSHQAALLLHTDLIRLRREDPTIANLERLDGAVLSQHAFVFRYFSKEGDDRLLVINLEADLWLNPAPEPLLAPLEGGGWRTLWSSESPRYNGSGTPPLETKSNWHIPGESAVLLGPDDNSELPSAKLSEKN